jgi:N-acetylglucosamine malate deacetylase 1
MSEAKIEVRAGRGLLTDVRYAEPLVQKELGLIEDLKLLPVQSI